MITQNRTEKTIAMALAALVLTAAATSQAGITAISDDFSSDTTGPWTGNVAISWDNSYAATADGATGDGNAGDGALVMDLTATGSEQIEFVFGGTLDLDETVDLDISSFTLNGSLQRLFRLQTSSDGSTWVNQEAALSSGGAAPDGQTLSMSYTATLAEATAGHMLRVILQDTVAGGTTDDFHIDSFVLTSTPAASGIPTPAALPAGLAMMTFIATRRRRTA